ncbi:hypothetical protein TWF730_005566 [Orbilia blumenaviensis]|uniref:Uncharacterized protein n=1 Tax=Orbilia blumenaviensis TaxID=1796055 RepID=A0AAV9VL37_9PEZI
MALVATCMRTVVLSLIASTFFSAYVSGFAFGFTHSIAREGNSVIGSPRIDRIDRVSPDYDCYSVIQPEPIRATDRPRVNEGELQTIKAAIVANWADTARMDAVAFYTTPDCREDTKALIVRWFTNMDIPQIAYLAAGFERKLIPKALSAYRPIVIPPGPAPEDDYALARIDFEEAVLRNPGLMKPGSVFVPARARLPTTYCSGLIRYVKFGEKTVAALGGLAKEYFQENPNAIEVPDNQDDENWPKLQDEFNKQLKHMLTSAPIGYGQPHTAQTTYNPGVFGCNSLRKEAYIDPREPGPINRNDMLRQFQDVVQQDEVILEPDQLGVLQGSVQEKIGQLQDKRITGSLIGTDDPGAFSTTVGPAVSDTTYDLPRDRSDQSRGSTGGRAGFRARRRNDKQSASEIGLDDENEGSIGITPTKVRLGEGSRGPDVRRLSDTGSLQNIGLQDRTASRETDMYKTDIVGAPGGQEWSTRIYNSLFPKDGKTEMERLNNMVDQLRQNLIPLPFSGLSLTGSQNGGTNGRMGLKIPIPIYRRPAQLDIEIPALQDVQDVQNAVNPSVQPSFIADLDEIWREYGGREPPVPGGRY